MTHRLRTRLFAALVMVGAAATVHAAPEHARLTAMCGSWDVEMTMWPRPGGPSLTAKGTSTIRPFGGDTWHQRTVIEPLSADAMLATSYFSYGTVPEWKGVEIKYTRRAT